MTIELPETFSGFRQAFDETCQRILQNEQDVTFCELFVQLAVNLRKHPLLKESLIELENEYLKRKQEFNEAALEALEETWKKLWKWHHRNFQHRKQLARIKRIITAPNEISYSSLYTRILFHLRKFCWYSPFFERINHISKAFNIAQWKKQSWCLQCQYDSKKRKEKGLSRITLFKLNEGDKRIGLHHQIIPITLKSPIQFKWVSEHLSFF